MPPSGRAVIIVDLRSVGNIRSAEVIIGVERLSRQCISFDSSVSVSNMGCQTRGQEITKGNYQDFFLFSQKITCSKYSLRII